MSAALREALMAAPEAGRLYATSPVFKKEVDKIFAVFDAAREGLSDEDYGEFLKWGVAMAEEWK